MSLIQRMCRQRCVYWQPIGEELDGGATFAPPVELKCRWEGRSVRLQSMFGDEKTYKEFVYVLQDVTPGGYLWLGRMLDLPPPKINDPRQVDDLAKRIEGLAKFGKLRATGNEPATNPKYLRVAAL